MAEGYPELKMFIDGEWVGAEGREIHKVVNPATGEVLAELPLATTADLDRALDAAARGYKLWRATPADQKAAVLSGAARLLRERIDHIARIATLEEGKTLPEARGETMMAAAFNPQHFIANGQGAAPNDSNGFPFIARYVVASGNMPEPPMPQKNQGRAARSSMGALMPGQLWPGPRLCNSQS